eukprot:7364472-Ditylum_brightwellii.AAC.1
MGVFSKLDYNIINKAGKESNHDDNDGIKQPLNKKGKNANLMDGKHLNLIQKSDQPRIQSAGNDFLGRAVTKTMLV